MKKQTLIPAVLIGTVLLSGCKAETAEPAAADTSVSDTSSSDTSEGFSESAGTGGETEASDMFSDDDMTSDYDESQAVSIELTGNTASCSSDRCR